MICWEEWSYILEDCFLDDDDKDTGKNWKILQGWIFRQSCPKSKNILQKNKIYQNDYMEYCSDLTMNPSGKVNRQFTFFNYFNDMQVKGISLKIWS